MPIAYEIDQAQSLIHTRCVGDLRFHEVIGHFHTLAQDPAVPGRLNVLLDLTGVESFPTGGQLRSVSETVGEVRTAVTFGACAIVAPQPALFGMMRMFEVFAAQHFRAMRVFRDIATAADWLQSGAEC